MEKDRLSHGGGNPIDEYDPPEVDIDELVEEMKSSYNDFESRIISQGIGESIIEPGKARDVLRRIRKRGYEHFVAITCVDMPEEERMQLIYHLWSHSSKCLIMIKCNVEREESSIPTVHDIYRPAITYEREIHEMFGVDFPGNPRLTEFILEDWEGPPPMRKDFDSISYVQKEYGIKIRNPSSVPPGLGKEGDK